MKRLERSFPLIIMLVMLLGVFVVWAREPKKSDQNFKIERVVNDIATASPSAPPVKKCPNGFILVPGSSLYKTDDFCVMKYSAKCALKTDPSKGLEPVPGSKCAGGSANQPNGTYKNNSAECFCTGEREVVSTASGFPITYIAEKDETPNNAIQYCQNKGWHLINNNEWMTIARNVEQVNDNWCDRNGANCGFAPGTPGKILVNGHNDSANEKSLGGGSGALISGEDSQPCFGTTTDRSNACGGKSSQKRVWTLSNGEKVWDLAGNVWQWEEAEILRRDQPKSKTNGMSDVAWLWSEFAPGAQKSVITDNGKGEFLNYDYFRPSNENWNSNQGVGRIFHINGEPAESLKNDTIIRGGNWRHGYDSGVFSIHISPVANKENIDDVGFRCTTKPN